MYNYDAYSDAWLVPTTNANIRTMKLWAIWSYYSSLYGFVSSETFQFFCDSCFCLFSFFLFQNKHIYDILIHHKLIIRKAWILSMIWKHIFYVIPDTNYRTLCILWLETYTILTLRSKSFSILKNDQRKHFIQ